MATKSIGMHTQHDDMMGELTRVLKRRGAAEAIEDRRCNLTKDAAEAAGRARAKAETKAKAEAEVRARCQPVHIYFAQEEAMVALQQSEEEISPTQTIKGNPQTKSYFETLPPPAARRALDLSTTVGVGQGGRMLGGSPKPAFLTELQQVLQKGSHESTEGGGGTSGARAERAESKSASSTNTPAAASAEAKGRALRSAPGPMPAPAGGMEDLMDELARVLKQRGAADTTVAQTAAATTVTRRPSFGRKKRPGQGEAAAGGLPVLALQGAPSTAEPPPPATAVAPAAVATAAVVTRRLSFGRKTKAKEKQPSAQVETAEPDPAPMAPDEPSTADEPPPPATTAPTRAATARAAAVVTRRLSFDRKTKAKEKQSSGHVETVEPDAVPVAPDEPSTAEPTRPATTATTEVPTMAATAAAAAGVTVGAAKVAVKVATASANVHQIDAFFNHCQARYAEASCVPRLAMIEEDSEQDEKEEVPVDQPSTTEPRLPRQESFPRAAARAAAAARRKAAVAATAATAVTASAVASLERKKRPAPLATKLEARRLTIELESCLENGLGLGLDASNRITEIKPAGQAAASRKLLLGDVVVSVNDTALEGRQLQHVLRPGVPLTLEVERGGHGFHRMRQLSFERKSAKQKRDEAERKKEAEMRKEAAEAEAEKVVDVISDRGDEGGASGGTPCATFAVAATAAADLSATIAAAELSTAEAASEDADEASANVALPVGGADDERIAAPGRGARDGKPSVLFDEHGSAIPTASATRGGGRLPAAPSSTLVVCLSALSRARQYAAQHRLPAASAAVTLTARRPNFLERRPGPPPTKRSPWVAATAATLVRVPSFGHRKLPAGPGGTPPSGEDDGLDEDLAV